MCVLELFNAFYVYWNIYLTFRKGNPSQLKFLLWINFEIRLFSDCNDNMCKAKILSTKKQLLLMKWLFDWDLQNLNISYKMVDLRVHAYFIDKHLYSLCTYVYIELILLFFLNNFILKRLSIWSNFYECKNQSKLVSDY